MPTSGVASMTSTQPSYQSTILIKEEETVSSPSGYAVAATTGQPGSSNAPPVPVMEKSTQLLSNDIGSATLAQKPNMADLRRQLAAARLAFLEAEALDYESDAESVTCHSVDVGDGTVSLGQPSPSTAQESPSVGVYSSPLPTTTPTPTNYSAGLGGNMMPSTPCTCQACLRGSLGPPLIRG